MTRHRCAVVLALVGLVGGPTLLARQSGPPPSFRASADVVAVTVHVAGPERAPLGGLTAGDFDVTINGRRRQVVSAAYVDRSGEVLPIRQGEDARAGFNELPRSGRPGRTFVVAIDASSFAPEQIATVLDAARAFVERVPPDDLVALHTLPTGPAVAPTTNRLLVRSAIDGISGRRTNLGGRFRLSPSDVVDIMVASGGMVALLNTRSGVGGGFEDSLDVPRVVSQFCSDRRERACAQAVAEEAVVAGREMDFRAGASLSAMSQMLRELETIPGQKFVLNLTAGLPFSDGRGGLDLSGAAKAMANQAALSRTTIYTVQIDDALRSDASSHDRARAQTTASMGRERDIRRRTLQQVADASGGAYVDTRPDIASALNWVLRDSASEYVLGVAVDPRDDGLGSLSVTVPRRRDATVRTPPVVVLARPRSS